MGWGLGSSKTAYKFKMVMYFTSDPRNRVHDIHGGFELEDGETVADAQEQIIAQYRKQEGIPRSAETLVLSWDYH